MKLIDKFFRSRFFVIYLPIVLFFTIVVFTGLDHLFFAVLTGAIGFVLYCIGAGYFIKDRAIIKRV